MGKARQHRWVGRKRGERKLFANTNQQNRQELLPVISIFLQASQQMGVLMRVLKDICNILTNLSCVSDMLA